ncbi:MAG: hypothetical protein LBJ25_06970 [Candidatus Margulisbacteria bacterium]|jgi:hypothetical protein|nr:hypothetical protein [Candidatus Margulisiibacteriota bacterium]
MQFLSIREFSRSPNGALAKLTKEGKAVLTNNGKPSAIMLKTDMADFEKTLAILEQLEFMQTVASLQMESIRNGKSKMTLAEINAEIRAARKQHVRH